MNQPLKRPPTTAWMWRADDGGTEGADLDLGHGVVRWYDSVACACEDNKLEQTFADFLKRGAHYGDPPPEIEAEMRAAVEMVVETVTTA
jgi:hypothetical protein